MTTPTDAAVVAAIDTAFGIIDLLQENPADANVRTHRMLHELISEYGTGGLAGVWMIWARSIAKGLHEAQLPVAAMFPAQDGKPDLRYARNAVIVAGQGDPAGIGQLIDAVWHDQEGQRTGATIDGTSAVLVAGVLVYGKPTNKTEWLRPTE